MSTTASARLAPLPRAEWDAAARDALSMAFSESVTARLLSTGPDAAPVPNVVGTLMHHPVLAGPFLAYNNVLLHRSALDPRMRELIVLRVAWRTRARYEWAQHVRLATTIGISAEEIAAVFEGADAEVWTPLEAQVLAATDQCIDGYRIADGTWERLAQELDARQLVELVFVVGTYAGLAMAFNSFALELEPELQALAAPSLAHFEE